MKTALGLGRAAGVEVRRARAAGRVDYTTHVCVCRYVCQCVCFAVPEIACRCDLIAFQTALPTSRVCRAPRRRVERKETTLSTSCRYDASCVPGQLQPCIGMCWTPTPTRVGILLAWKAKAKQCRGLCTRGYISRLLCKLQQFNSLQGAATCLGSDCSGKLNGKFTFYLHA